MLIMFTQHELTCFQANSPLIGDQKRSECYKSTDRVELTSYEMIFGKIRHTFVTMLAERHAVKF